MDTNGWDTVFVADIVEVNKSLANSVAKLLPNFQFQNQDAGINATGDLATWQIVPGGSGELLYLEITLANARLTEAGQNYDISGVQLVFKVSLNLLPAPDVPRGQQLRFHFASFNEDAGSDDGAISLVTAVDPSGKLTVVQTAVVGRAVGQALVDGASDVSFIFATINPLAASGVAWLQPVRSTYSYADVVDSDRHWLGILSVSTDRSISGLSSAIDSGLLGPGQTVGLALSQGLFLGHMLVPALAAGLHTSPNYFGFANTPDKGPGIVSNTPFNLPAVSAAGESYTPVVTWLEAVVKDTQLELSFGGTCDMGMNITMTFDTSAVLQASYSSATNGVAFATVGTPTFNKSVSVPWYDRLLDVTVVSAVIFETTVASIGAELGTAVGQASNLGNLSTQAPALVNWLERTGFTPTDGGLATSFYLRGQL